MKDIYTPISQFNYSTDYNNNITLKKYVGNDKIVNIAPEYTINNENYKVKSLGMRCFYVSDIEKIILPDTITELGSMCFENTNLKEIKLPDSIGKIPYSCFTYCQKLQQVILPSKLVEIDEIAFSCCYNLKALKLNNKIEKIKARAFYNCNNLELKDFENQHIKIKNNNIYNKQKISYIPFYILTNSLQKEDTLLLKGNERINNLSNANIKNLIIPDRILHENEINILYLDTLILPNTIEIRKNSISSNNIRNLYLSNNIKKIETKQTRLNNLYYNGTIDQFRNIEGYKNINYKNLIYKKDIEKLLNDNYNFKQIDLIIKGYQKGILLSNINPNIDENILRDIINNFTYEDIELYNMLELLNKETINLEDNLRIQNIINNKIKGQKNKSEKEIINKNIRE